MLDKKNLERKRLLWFAYLIALAAWGLFSYVTLFSFLGNGTMFAFLEKGRPYINDFVNTYNSSLLGRRYFKEKLNVYDPVIQNSSVERLIAPVKPEIPFYFQYPPHFFLVMAPLSYVSLSAAWCLWFICGIVLCLCGAFALNIRGVGSTFTQCFV